MLSISVYVVSTACWRSDDSTVRIWDLRTYKSTRCLRGVFGGEGVSSVAWSSRLTGAEACSVSENSCTIFTAAGSKVFAFDLRMDSVILTTSSAEYAYNTDEVNQICVASDSKGDSYLASADDSGGVCLIAVATGRLAKVMRRHTMFASTIDMKLRPGGHIVDLVSGGFDCTAVLW
jgi:WD40 repeat protein